VLWTENRKEEKWGGGGVVKRPFPSQLQKCETNRRRLRSYIADVRVSTDVDHTDLHEPQSINVYNISDK
jgi:hypothetical protein